MTNPAADPTMPAAILLSSTTTVGKAAALGALKTLGTGAALAAAGFLLAHDYIGAGVGAAIAIGSLTAYEKL